MAESLRSWADLEKWLKHVDEVLADWDRVKAEL